MALSLRNPNLILLLIASLLDIIAVGMPYWIKMQNLSISINMGLWAVCRSGTCVKYETVNDEISVARGLHMFALVVGVSSWVVFIISEWIEKPSLNIRRILCTVLCLHAGAFILIADCYMATTYKLYGGCLVPSLIAALLFIFVGGRSSVTCVE